MVSHPLVSIIVPVFNRVDLLKDTLLSIKNQSYRNFEVVLIDDASHLIFNLKDLETILEGRPLSYHKLTKNQGPGKARSVGRTFAKGTYVAYLDSDDLWEPTFLEKTVLVLEENDTVSMVFTNVLLKRTHRVSKRLSLDEGIYDFYDLIFRGKKYWATGAALWRSNISLSLNWNSFRDHEDYVHDILSLLTNPQIYHLPEALCVVNKNKALGIPRSNKDMLKSLLLLSKSDLLFQTLTAMGRKTDFLSFIIWRLSKRRYTKNDLVLFFKLYVSLIKWSGGFKTISVIFMKLIRHKFD